MQNNEFVSRFSETVEKILRDAEAIAAVMGTGVNTEHLLSAIAANPGTIAYETLREAAINTDQISYAIAQNITEKSEPGSISLDFRRALKNAYRLAAKYNTPTVDSEHLLLALTVQKNSNAYKILQSLTTEPTRVRNELEDYFNTINNSPNTTEEEADDYDFAQDGNLQPQRAKSNRGGASAIEYFTTDITKLAQEGKLDPVVGRENEITRMCQILVRRIKNNPVLTGEPGVGKTAIVEGLAARIASKQVPPQLRHKRILMLDLALMVSGTTYRGQFEERAKKLMDEIKAAGNIIVFIDEIHTIVGAGAAEGSMDLGHIFKPSLAKGVISIIGATTNEEYRKYIEKDAALERRFQRINVAEPSVEETIEILSGLKKVYEKHHNVEFTAGALKAAAELTKRYINDRFLPDKAIDVIDEAAAKSQLESTAIEVTDRLAQLEKQRQKAHNDHIKARDEYEYEKAMNYRTVELRLEKEIEALKSSVPKQSSATTINEEHIAQIVSMSSGVPIGSLIKESKYNLENIEKKLSKYVVGQDKAIKSISAAIRRSQLGISNPNRPLGTFIFLGPTGVGKTELVRVLAREVYGREESLIKIDMSEFMERHSTARLVGAPPGYVGYEDAGKLTEAVRRSPYSIVLLDEIEKAHPDVFNLLLQIMEDGYLTDAKGRRVSFKNTIIIMTSNIGMSELNNSADIGFKIADVDEIEKRINKINESVNSSLKDYFAPEFLNRLDEVIIFNPLDRAAVKKIVQMQLDELGQRLAKQEIVIEFSEPVIELLCEKGFDPEFGARPVRRAVTELIENPLADLLINKKISTTVALRALRKGDVVRFVK